MCRIRQLQHILYSFWCAASGVLNRPKPVKSNGEPGLRQIVVGLYLVLALTGLPASSAAETCIACRYFDTLEMAGDSKVFSEAMSRLETRPLAAVSLSHEPFCETGRGALAAGELLAAADRQSTRAQEIIRKARQCPDVCGSVMSEAEYCGFRDRLITDRYRLGAVALRLADLADVYERAGNEGRFPLEILSDDMTLYGGESLNVLTDALKALVSGNPDLVPELRWQASSTEVSGLFDAIALLADFSLIGGDAKDLEAALEQATTELATMRDVLIVALTRARIMQPAEQRTLEHRILTAASNLAWVIASLQASAEAQLSTADRDPRAVQGTVGCLNRLSRNAFTGSEAPGMTIDILNGCRPFGSCPSGDPDPSQAAISPLRAFLKTQDETDIRTSALISSMCPAN